MKALKKLCSAFLVLAMALGMIPGAIAAGTTEFSAASLAVGAKVLYAKYSVATTEDGALKESPWQTNVSLSDGVKFGAVWDSENLYLGFVGTSAPAAPTSITLNDVSVTRAGKTGATTREIRIPLREAGVTISDYDPATKLSITLGSAQWTGTLVFDSVEGASINNFPVHKTENQSQVDYDSATDTLHFTGKGDGTVLVRHTGASTAKTTNTIAEKLKIIDPAKLPVALEFDCRIDKMAVYKRYFTSTTQKETCFGLYFTVGGKIANEDGNMASTNSAGMTFGITNTDEGLVLALRATDFADGAAYADAAQEPKKVVLNKTVGQQFHLRLNYDAAKDTIDVFVDDVFKGRFENAEFDNPFRYNASQGYLSHLQIGAYTTPGYISSGENAFDISISHLTVGAQKVMNPSTLMDGLTFDVIKGRNGSVSAIYSDLELVASIPGPLTIPLTWTSSNPAIVGTDGKVAKVTKDETVTLTAKLTNDPSKSKSFTLTVKAPEAAFTSPERAEAAFAKPAVTVDGVLSEKGWRMGGRILGQNNMMTAEYGFQWNQTHLFAAIDFANSVGPVALTFNGHRFTVENGKLLENGAEVAGAKLAVGDSAMELSIPHSAIGMGSKITTYGKSMPIHVTVNGIDGPATSLTLTDIAWFATINRNNSPKYSTASQVKVTGNNPVAGYQGATKTENGWRIYDLYNPSGDNPAGIRTYVMYQDPGFDDRTVGTRLEFDFRAAAMPIGQWDEPAVAVSAYCNYGFTMAFGTKYNDAQEAWSVVCGIVNTEEGLVLAMRNNAAYKVNLDKKVGDTFNVAVEWNRDDTLDVYVDGVLKGTMAAASMFKKGASNQSVVFNIIRSPHLAGAASAEDNYDVTLSNISFGNTYDEGGLLGKLTFADIAGSNTSADMVTGNLNLTNTITDGLLDNTYPITWTSSDERIVTSRGVVTQPNTGVSFATVTATAGGLSKSFDLTIPGKTMDNSKVLYLENDLNPAKGAGRTFDKLLFTFDTNNNSIIAIKDKSEKINLVTLTDGDDKARLNAESLTLWVSEDNLTYTQVRDFKLVQIDKNWYLYDFEARGQYVKVHYTHYRGEGASFVGALGTMITAGYDTPLVKGGSTEYTVTNNTTVKYDAALPIPGLTGDLSRLRVFSKSGELLYHYVDGDTVIVRYPELALGASATVYVQQAAAGAIELACKENVYEVTYGNREVINDTSKEKANRWIMALPAGTKFPNGSKLEQDTIYAMGGKLNISTDGGRTWQEHSKVLNTISPVLHDPVERMGGSGAFTFDHHTGRMFFQTYYVYNKFNNLDITQSHCEQMVIASDNGGKNWYLASTLPRDIVNDPQSAYMLTYSGGTVLESYDGDGRNVDMVFPMGAQYNNMGGFCCRVAYTRDAGKSWQLSESKITYGDIATNSENGCSEAFIQDRGDGVLVLYTRCQDESLDNFGVSYSLDQGVTWLEEAVLSKMYTTNTQATITDIEVNGKMADLSIWGGNTALGGRSYIRNPLNVAVSVNGSETYRNIQNLFFESEMENYGPRNYTITNPTVAKINEKDMFITFQDLSGTRFYIQMFVQDFDKWLTRTRGGYDNFEHGTTQYEGWITYEGDGTALSTTNARDKYSMQIIKDSVITRSVPYLQNGTVSMDLYTPANASFTLELQSAFSPVYADVAMPIGLRAENGKLYMNNSGKAIADLKAGWNTLTFDLELTRDAATLSVNGGTPVALDVIAKAGDYVTYITFGTGSDIWVDEVLITSELEPVMASTAADKSAADSVINQIKALEKLSAQDRVEKVMDVRAAFDALTQTQQDLIDRRVVGNAKAPVEQAMVNYYKVLMDYAGPVTFADVKISDWYYDAVSYATANGIMSGYSADKFGPNDTLNRAMVVQLLYNKEGQPLLNGLKHSFSDVPADQWFNNAVTWGSANKVVSGFGGGVFKPNDTVTIEQVAVILRNYSGSPSGTGDLSKVGNHSDWAADALRWAVEAGILDNVPFTNATEQATRAQAAQMLTNFLRAQ